MGNAEHNWAVVKTTVAPIKLKPFDASELADEALYGMVLKILGDIDNGWYYIETHYGYRGYVHEDNILLGDEQILQWQECAKHVVTHSIADVLNAPTYKGHVIQVLTRGALVEATGNEQEGWSEINLPLNRKGWIRSSFIKKMDKLPLKENEDIVRENLVNTALSYLGTQYRWGGKSPMGIDCSGLCSISYLINGIIIYRDAVLKEEYMRAINREDMKKGDLLFFPGHVAMYIGNDKYVHSTSIANGVVINSLNPMDEDYRKDLADQIINIGTIF